MILFWLMFQNDPVSFLIWFFKAYVAAFQAFLIRILFSDQTDAWKKLN